MYLVQEEVALVLAEAAPCDALEACSPAAQVYNTTVTYHIGCLRCLWQKIRLGPLGHSYSQGCRVKSRGTATACAWLQLSWDCHLHLLRKHAQAAHLVKLTFVLRC